MKHKDNTNSYITGFILLSVLLIFGIPNAHAISMGITGILEIQITLMVLIARHVMPAAQYQCWFLVGLQP